MVNEIVVGILCWAIVALIVVLFMYSASKNNQEYDKYSLQRIYFDKYVDSQIPAFAQYVGDDRKEIRCNEYTLITIENSKNEKIKVNLEDSYIIYDNLQRFNYEWRFVDEW